MAWQDTFGSRNWTDAFGATEGRSNPHRGTDLAVGTLPAWERLTVVNSDLFYSALGYCVVLRAADGKLFGVAHTRKGTRAGNGAVLEPGDTIAEAASGPVWLNQNNIDFPGTQWAGKHFHITHTAGADPFGSSGLLDARPRIVASAGGGPVTSGYGLTPEAQGAAQGALKKLNLYSGPIDNAFGENSVKGMQQYLKNQGFLSAGYDVDGIPGPNYGKAIQQLAQKYGYSGPLDGEPGAETSKAIVKWAQSVLNSTTPPPVTPPVTPPVRPTSPIWTKTYPATSVVVPSPNREVRKAGSVIKYVFAHVTMNPVDHTAYFARSNEREVAPNLYIRPSGEVKEFVRLGERAWTTAVVGDHSAVTVEFESADGTITTEQYNSFVALLVWLSKQTSVDNVPVDFKLTRQNVLGHKEVPDVTSGTSCPGKLPLDALVLSAIDAVKPIAKTIAVPEDLLKSWLLASGSFNKEIEKLLQ